MDKWDRLPLSSAFWFQEGPGVRNWQFKKAGIKLLNVANVTTAGEIDLSKTERYLSPEEVSRRYSHFLIDSGDLVIASSGISFDEDGLLRTRGAFVRKSHLPLCLNTSTIRFKPRDNRGNLLFLKYWLDSTEFRSQISRMVTGSAQQNFGPSHLNNICISLPDLVEQKRIAGVLEQADRLRRLRRYALELGDGLLQASFIQFFGDLRRNEKSWTFRQLEEVSEIASGVAKGQRFGNRETVQVPYLRVANVQDGFLDLSEIKMIRALPDDVEALRLKRGDIVMTEGGDFDKLGRGAIWRGQVKDCIHQNHIFRVRLEEAAVLPTFFAQFLRTPFAKGYFLRCSKQTTNLATINMTQLRATPVPLPPVSLQLKFAALVGQHDRLRHVHLEALRQAEHLFQTLLHRAFTTGL